VFTKSLSKCGAKIYLALLRTFIIALVKLLKPTLILTVTASLLLSATSLVTAQSVGAATETGPGLKFLGRWISGSGIGGAEISAYDAATSRIYVTNGATNQIDIVDISNPAAPKKVKSLDHASKGVTGIQSVAAKNGTIAIAASMASSQAPGKVFLADIDGELLDSAPNGVDVGSLPDHVTFSPDGQFVLSANEGEPKSYCLTDGKLPTTTDPNGSVSIIDVNAATPVATTLTFEAFNDRASAIAFEGGRIFGPNATVAQDLEPEYISVSPDSKYAFVTLQENNMIATIDLESKEILNLTALGYKDHSKAGNGLDSNNKDLAAAIAPKSTMGMYLPDAIASTRAGGVNFLFTANEGDSRSYPCVMGGTSTTIIQDEDASFSKIADSSVSSTLKADAGIGQLKTTPFAPASVAGSPVTSSTKVKSAYSFGTRSFSVWKSNTVSGIFKADLVYDSGDLLENLAKEKRGNLFNADWDTTTGAIKAIDARSASKGPEPEGIAVGSAYNRKWMALTLERDGGVVLFDVTKPETPQYVDYINTSIPTGNIVTGKATATAGDVSPEGVMFVQPLDSPTATALVIVSYELSGTVAIYEIPSKRPHAPTRMKISVKDKGLTINFAASKIKGWSGSARYVAVCTSVTGTRYTATSTKSPIVVKMPFTAKRSYRCTLQAKSSTGNSAILTSKTVYGSK
jgi:DNA-binding beta-propeller fold protein YncE